MTLHVLTVHKIVKVIESVDKMCDAITKIKSDVSGIPEIKANVADLLHCVNEMDHNVKNAQEMRDNVVELSDSVEDQNTQIRGAQECMLLLANQVDDLRDEVERHERNEQRFRAHENSRFGVIERRLDWIMTRLDIPQPQPDERW